MNGGELVQLEVTEDDKVNKDDEEDKDDSDSNEGGDQTDEDEDKEGEDDYGECLVLKSIQHVLLRVNGIQ